MDRVDPDTPPESPLSPESLPEIIEPEPIVERPVFTGSGKEYFGIWIVNVLLTIVTLGIYIPWARVRTRRYFYENTKLFGSSFEYLASPGRILVGYLVVGALYGLYMTLGTFNPLWAFPVIIIIFAITPWLIYKALRFKAAYSAYRNVPFSFTGELGSSYAVYMGYPMLTGLTLGLIWPLVLFKQKEYFFDNFKYGENRSNFRGEPKYFYKIYFGLGAIFLVVFFLLAYLVNTAYDGSFFEVAGPNEYNEEVEAAAGLIFLFLFYVPFFLFLFFVKAFIQNYCWNKTKFDMVLSFKSTLNPFHYAWIQASNVIVSVLSLGLLYPWAKVRMQRYVCTHFEASLDSSVDLDAVAADARETVNSVGDGAAEFLDIDFGF